MRAARCGGALLLVAACLAVLVPPAAATDASVSFLEAPKAGATLQGGQRVSAEAAGLPPLGLRSFSLEVTSEHGTVTLFTKTYDKPLAEPVYRDEVAVTWDTYSQTPRNGVYTLVASASGQIDFSTGLEGARQQIGDLKVNNPPARPAGVSAEIQGESVSLGWSPNGEPDLLKYAIERQAGSETFQRIGSVDKGARAFVDSAPPKDVEMRYRVVAIRSNWDGSGVLESAPATSSPVVITTLPPAGTEAGAGAAPGQAPAPAPAPSPRVIRGPKEAGIPQGFQPTLPYTEPLPEQAPTEVVEIETAQADRPPEAAGSGVSTTSPLPVADKVRFLAAALVLLVFALHVARVSRRMFHAEPVRAGAGRDIVARKR